MRLALLFTLLLPLVAHADNDPQLAAAIKSGHVHRIDRCMRRFIQREGPALQPHTALHHLGSAEVRMMVLYEMLRRQIGVLEVDWDRCVPKAQTWPGTYTLGVVLRTRDGHVDDLMERCYTIKGGVPGTLRLFGWRPHVRKDRHDLKCVKARACLGFLEEQRAYCDRWGR
ncbi:MAG: hypothetical protein IPJ85_13585 [Flavobacteriales bacterium]|nr:hypothetical protein [Flavobacteriales bacterium]